MRDDPKIGLVTNDHCSSYCTGSTLAILSTWYQNIHALVSVGPRIR